MCIGWWSSLSDIISSVVWLTLIYSQKSSFYRLLNRQIFWNQPDLQMMSLFIYLSIEGKETFWNTCAKCWYGMHVRKRKQLKLGLSSILVGRPSILTKANEKKEKEREKRKLQKRDSLPDTPSICATIYSFVPLNRCFCLAQMHTHKVHTYNVSCLMCFH